MPMHGGTTLEEYALSEISLKSPDRMISASKSGYRKRYPNNLVIFNANLATKTRGKIWHGDLDVTRDADQLQSIAAEVGEDVYVLSEMDARFSNERTPRLENALAIIRSNGVEYPTKPE